MKPAPLFASFFRLIERRKMIKLGMKLFSTNCLQTPDFAASVIDYVNAHDDMFLELMAVPGSFEATHAFFGERVKTSDVVVHNAHEAYDFNAADRNRRETNRQMLDESRRFADELNASVIVVHAGNGFGRAGQEETVYQFRHFNDSRVAVENLPMINDITNEIMHGLTPEMIAEIKDASGCKFCFDFAHAICAANGLGLRHDDVMAGFAALTPDMYHLCDGDFTGEDDVHWHYGEGSYDLDKYLARYIAPDALVTMETGGKPAGIQPWINDREYIRRLQRQL